jgi:hypothetical protein
VNQDLTKTETDFDRKILIVNTVIVISIRLYKLKWSDAPHLAYKLLTTIQPAHIISLDAEKGVSEGEFCGTDEHYAIEQQTTLIDFVTIKRNEKCSQ